MSLKALLFCLVLVLLESTMVTSQTFNQQNDFDLALQAIKQRNGPELEKLLKQTPQLVNQKDVKFGANLLHFAAVERDPEIIRLLLDHKASPADRNKEQATPLMLAVFASPKARWDTKAVIILLAPQAVVNLPASMGKTALHFAAKKGDEEIVRALLEAGASPTAKTAMMEEPWEFAVNERIRRILFDSAAARHAENLQGSLHKYAKTGNLAELKALLKNSRDKINLNTRNAKQETALIIAAKNLHFEIVAYLIKMDADFNLQDQNGNKVWAYLCPRKLESSSPRHSKRETPDSVPPVRRSKSFHSQIVGSWSKKSRFQTQ